MKVALVTIGNELLSGFTTNTNAAWIGKELLNAGAQVVEQVTVGDEKSAIQNVLNTWSQRDFTAVIVTGGLGPTHDDITAEVFYEFFEAQALFDQEYWDKLEARFSTWTGTIPSINRNQALRPDTGDVIPNPLGSARGLHFQRGDQHFFALPGVPREMKAMISKTIIPWMAKQERMRPFHIRTLRTTGIAESALAEKLDPVIQGHPGCTVAFLPQIPGVDVRISSHQEKDVLEFEADAKARLETIIYGFDDQSLEEIVAEKLLDRKLTIATAESCTGGYLGHLLTNVSGSSGYMLGGVVSYSNAIKETVLGVSKEILETFGAVSKETAAEMAMGIRRLMGSDLGVSITGIAGPTGGTEDKPVGLVFIGLAIGERPVVRRFRFGKDRALNKLRSTHAALNIIRLEGF